MIKTTRYNSRHRLDLKTLISRQQQLILMQWRATQFLHKHTVLAVVLFLQSKQLIYKIRPSVFKWPTKYKMGSSGKHMHLHHCETLLHTVLPAKQLLKNQTKISCW